MESRMVADPLRLLHCCPISDGAAAVVLTSERAAVRVAGIGQGTDTLAVRHRTRPHELPRHAGRGARRPIAMAGFGPERVDVAEIHDAFAPVRADLARGYRARAGRQGGARHARRRDRPRRAAAHQPVGRAQGARPSAGRHRHRADRGVRLAAHRTGRRPPGARRAWRSPTPSAASPPTTGSPSWSRAADARDAIARLALSALPAPRGAARRRICPDHPVRDGRRPSLPRHSARSCRSPRCTRRPRGSGRRCTSPSSSSTGGARLVCHGDGHRGRQDRLARGRGSGRQHVLLLAPRVRSTGRASSGAAPARGRARHRHRQERRQRLWKGRPRGEAKPAPARRRRPPKPAAAGRRSAALAGVRVLDLTRVLAGPVLRDDRSATWAPRSSRSRSPARATTRAAGRPSWAARRRTSCR